MTKSSRTAEERRLYAYEHALLPEEWDSRFEGLEELERVELEIIARLTARPPGQPPRRILDVGCGTGRMQALYPNETYVGLDRSYPFIRYCHEKRSREGVAFLLADMDHIPFPWGSFDLVFVIGTLESEPCPAQRIASLTRYLRPGGQLVFTLQNRRNLPGRLANALSRGYHQTFWSHRQLVTILSNEYSPFEVATCFLLPPGVPRFLFRTIVKSPWARRLLVRPYAAVERLSSRAHLHLGYEWIVSVTRRDRPLRALREVR